MECKNVDYKELIENLKNMLPEKILYSDLICAEGAYAHSGPLVYEDPEPYFIEQAITAITELIARVEDAENDEQDENSRPVVRGRWEIVTGSNGKEYMVCSECRVTQTLTGTFSYCPNCGADMREDNG